MNVSFDILSFLNTIGIILGLFLSIVIFTYQRGNRRANRILAFFFLLLSFSISYSVLHPTSLYYYVPHLFLTGKPCHLLVGPVFYLYIRAATVPGDKFRQRDIAHFIPSVLGFLYFLPEYMLTAQEKINAEYMIYGEMTARFIIYWGAVQVNFIAYILSSWLLFKKYRKNLKNVFSTIDKVYLSWTRFMIISMFLIAQMFLVLSLIPSSILSNKTSDFLIALSVSVLIILLAFRSLRQPEIFISLLPETREDENTEQQAVKYEKSLLDNEEADKYGTMLKNLMETGESFKDPALTLDSLAEKLSISRHNLSQLINDKMEQSFYDFINFYRVEAVKKYLMDPGKGKTSILELAYEAGFNSKATFNACFKKNTGMTPSRFRELSA
ncbi:MAG: AraC family transcriptional regulator [bacterium]|nr:AraC family transcriptional regulator [bacterium]